MLLWAKQGSPRVLWIVKCFKLTRAGVFHHIQNEPVCIQVFIPIYQEPHLISPVQSLELELSL